MYSSNDENNDIPAHDTVSRSSVSMPKGSNVHNNNPKDNCQNFRKD